MNCYCGSEKKFADCCELLHQGNIVAKTAVELMRSRFSAYCVKNIVYLKKTSDPQTTSNFDFDDMKAWADQVQFKKLQIIRSEEVKNKGLVEFKAVFIQDGVEKIHHELSTFRRHLGQWYFRDGEVFSE